MPFARFKDLCIDARDADRLGRFWATTLGLEYVAHDDGSARLTGATSQHTIWVNAVAEPKTVKHRVHFDVHTESIADLEGVGATVVERSSGRPWTVMADPEGGEFCAFIRDEMRDYRLYEVVVDAIDPEANARWWATVFGVPVQSDEQGRWWWIEDVPEMPFENIVFVPVPEPKRVKNRIHWDVETDSVDALVEAGAALLRAEGDDGIEWTVLADPEGNEFCAFTSP